MKALLTAMFASVVMQACADERYPAQVIGMEAGESNVCLHVWRERNERPPFVESSTSLHGYDWHIQEQSVTLNGDTWLIAVRRNDVAMFYRAWRRDPPITVLNGLVAPAKPCNDENTNTVPMRPTCGSWDGNWG